jgi:hypothetical protein
LAFAIFVPVVAVYSAVAHGIYRAASGLIWADIHWLAEAGAERTAHTENPGFAGRLALDDRAIVSR